ncbi:uncharacterized protein [Rutidosis leptorrhynchoides]|uniref:uncharacterized protein n=1 Tax=Rutidosis leptorrhynchoides TaxID=125765 RepID=UPI003A99AD17
MHLSIENLVVTVVFYAREIINEKREDAREIINEKRENEKREADGMAKKNKNRVLYITEEDRDKKVVYADIDKDNVELMQKSLLGEVKKLEYLEQFGEICAAEGLDRFTIKYLGGFTLLLTFENSATATKIVEDKNHFIHSWLNEVKLWDKLHRNAGRLTWLSVVGVPKECWNIKTFKSIVFWWGPAIDTFNCEFKGNQSLIIGKVLVHTKCHERINGQVKVIVDNKEVYVQVVEETDDIVEIEMEVEKPSNWDDERKSVENLSDGESFMNDGGSLKNILDEEEEAHSGESDYDSDDFNVNNLDRNLEREFNNHSDGDDEVYGYRNPPVSGDNSNSQMHVGKTKSRLSSGNSRRMETGQTFSDNFEVTHIPRVMVHNPFEVLAPNLNPNNDVDITYPNNDVDSPNRFNISLNPPAINANHKPTSPRPITTSPTQEIPCNTHRRPTTPIQSPSPLQPLNLNKPNSPKSHNRPTTPIQLSSPTQNILNERNHQTTHNTSPTITPTHIFEPTKKLSTPQLNSGKPIDPSPSPDQNSKSPIPIPKPQSPIIPSTGDTSYHKVPSQYPNPIDNNTPTQSSIPDTFVVDESQNLDVTEKLVKSKTATKQTPIHLKPSNHSLPNFKHTDRPKPKKSNTTTGTSHQSKSTTGPTPKWSGTSKILQFKHLARSAHKKRPQIKTKKSRPPLVQSVNNKSKSNNTSKTHKVGSNTSSTSVDFKELGEKIGVKWTVKY